MSEIYAQVILPLPLHDVYTYRVPGKWQSVIQAGQRVVVQFGAKKYYAALVYSLSDVVPEGLEIKEITQLLDEEPIVSLEHFEMWKWIAHYYCCTLGDVFRAAIPAGLKLESKSKVLLTDLEDEQVLSDKEFKIIEQVKKGALSIQDLQKALGKIFSYQTLKLLVEKKVIRIEEKMDMKYKVKTEVFVVLHPESENEFILQKKVDSLQRAKKQKALLFHFFEKTGISGITGKRKIGKKELLKGTGFSSSLLNELVRKKILLTLQKPVSRLNEEEVVQAGLSFLNASQVKALDEVKACFTQKKVTLLHGITASGKTEIYIHLIDEKLKRGQQVLYLLPEIALTTQIIARLVHVFGNRVGIYHSRMNSQERVEVWQKVLQYRLHPEEGYQVILGARSALFLPFSRLGLIIVDEEHDISFKQSDPAPRYHARDMAVVLARQHRADILLGSATPSFESFYNGLKGKYGIVFLGKKHFDLEPPEIIVADLIRARKKKQMKSVLTPELYQLMEEALQNKEQVILFQNRRGYSPYLQCYSCGWIPKCDHCDVSLTYHKYKEMLICHYCGYSQPLPKMCVSCGSTELLSHGIGTEKIEEELISLFPGKKIERMDLDTTRSKNAFERIIQDLDSGKTDILIGTQMVTKGLDFEHVYVVGIIDVDSLIGFPDFRAHERAFQLVSQVSGRAGRKHRRGKVVIQTSQPTHPIIELMQQQDYKVAFHAQIAERKMFRYPPFVRLIKLVVKHKQAEYVHQMAEELAGQIKKSKAFTVLGPEFPMVSRIRQWYIKEIWLKINPGYSLDGIKEYIRRTAAIVVRKKENRQGVIHIDVDPV
ncbi:MAG: primosomal protein N' [Mariniphaga sp.]|nr:primosomal protein N' [Mariniphaga sp.]